MNNQDIQKLMNILSNMDKKDLEAGINQVSNILKTTDKEQIIKVIKNSKK